MSKRRFAIALICVLLFSTFALCQSSDWSAVRRLYPGTAISVRLEQRRRLELPLRFPCEFQSASADELVCRRPGIGELFPLAHIARAEIRELRLERPDANTAVCTTAGAATGVVLGAARHDAANAVLAGIALGSVGWVVGKTTKFVHGKVVYRSR